MTCVYSGELPLRIELLFGFRVACYSGPRKSKTCALIQNTERLALLTMGEWANEAAGVLCVEAVLQSKKSNTSCTANMGNGKLLTIYIRL